MPYSSVIAKGIISKNPKVIPLRHVIFSIKDDTAEVDCAAYEPTGNLRKIARELLIGDKVEVYGAVHEETKNKPLTINLEKIKILNLIENIQLENPLCSSCGRRLKSMGKKQGFRCEKCGSKYSELKKKEISIPRTIKTGLYVTSIRSQRHLTKPLSRYGKEKSDASTCHLIDNWHNP
jgi:tRNA(Ile2)-agmatinylcytidine synthase